MNNQLLREKLEQLHAELEQAQSVDDSTREYLNHLQRDIQTFLEEKDPSRQHHSLNQRLGDAMKRLEESHPDLVMTIGRVIDHLAQV